MIGDRPADEASAVAVDHGGQIEVPATRRLGERQVGDVADVALSGSWSGEVPLEQVGHLLIGGFGQGGVDLSLLDVAGDAGRAHHASDALVVDPLTGRRTVVELGGDPRRPQVLSSSWTARIRSVSAASAPARSALVGLRPATHAAPHGPQPR